MKHDVKLEDSSQMVTRTPEGKYIISAGEVGAYTVCPEAWRLNAVEGVRAERSRNSKNIKKGEELHREWAEKYDELLYLSRTVKIIILLIIGSLLAVFLNT